MYCIAAADSDPGTATGTRTAVTLNEGVEPAVDSNAVPAIVQVVPYDVMLKPGQTQGYHVRLYNERGQFLRIAAADEVTFSVDGQGAMSADGTYTAPGGDKHIASRIVASVSDKQGVARVRIVPALPWNWDFNELDDVPLTWVGGRVRYVLRDGDGGKYMAKRDLIPTRPGQDPTKLGTRSRLWMGPTDLANYTIQADVQFTEKEGKLPDVGLINSRYTMALGGEHQQVRIYSWSTHDKRHQDAQEMPVEPGKWYTLKLRVEPHGDQATVLGKVWPSDENEPDDWTLGMTDTAPNLHGSPGLYGDTKNTEVYLDNISVVPNN